jgi:hypothetical protein
MFKKSYAIHQQFNSSCTEDDYLEAIDLALDLVFGSGETGLTVEVDRLDTTEVLPPHVKIHLRDYRQDPTGPVTTTWFVELDEWYKGLGGHTLE